ncbi:choice-of-anchor I family protein [Demequina sp. SYSU T00192]|uniref:Choice-of-anchor I family protein n=1 Tax=Demequina litoralis TaxID=3051660 RepID=A0ABT8GCP1_9MICO|nr:choice-of-anchor I family protein [Demequina sp. SYSU T00192]MDN4476912.1 choice-of-anchor I family protein [Demequina sp. SYSU T00192]
MSPVTRPLARRGLAVGAVVALGAAAAAPAYAAIVGAPIAYSASDAALSLTPIGTHETGVFDESAAEIVQFHAATQRLFTVDALAGQVRVLDASDPTDPTELLDLVTAGVTAADKSVIPAGAVANSVAVREDGLVLVAVESDPKTDRGWLVFFDAAGDGTALGAVRVGAQPDMVTITPDGSRAVTADEGEPNDDYDVDPEGTISVVSLPGTVAVPKQAKVRTATFHSYEGSRLPEGVRIFAGIDGANHPVSRNLEPEYVTVDAASTTAYVTLQENNAIAVVDLHTARVTDILPLGAKDHAVAGNGIDASNRDGGVSIQTWPIHGLYMPDAIASYTVDGETYLVTANEGDAREWGDYEEPVGYDDLVLCDDNPAAGLGDNELLGRLDFTPESGLSADGSCYEELYAFGARSFSIWTTDGAQVFDSGDDFEQITAAAAPESFNASNTNNELDNRSDNKGPEPEGVTIGEVEGRTYAFVGLERVGGVMVYDVTDPAASTFVTYVSNRDFGFDPEDELASAGDLGPEGLAFIPAADSPSGAPLLAVANEVSGTTTLFEISIR